MSQCNHILGVMDCGYGDDYTIKMDDALLDGHLPDTISTENYTPFKFCRDCGGNLGFVNAEFLSRLPGIMARNDAERKQENERYQAEQAARTEEERINPKPVVYLGWFDGYRYGPSTDMPVKRS